MKICAACQTDLPKASYSKKQWKLDQRRCKICVTNDREVQPTPKQNNNDQNTNEVIKSLDSVYLASVFEKKISDEELFKQPQYEDCPICFERLPALYTGHRYMSCCGKVICSGCCYAPVYDNQGNVVTEIKCPFCRTPEPDTDEEINEREKKRVELNDPIAMHNLGNYYRDGIRGFPQDHEKALGLWHRAAELGYSEVYNNIGFAYNNGEGVEIDKKKAIYYYELAAMGGNATARHNLGNNEARAGNIDRSIKHLMIAVRSGSSDSLNTIKRLYSNGHATKEDYTKALQSYQAYLGEIKSDQRDKAAATYEDNRYY